MNDWIACDLFIIQELLICSSAALCKLFMKCIGYTFYDYSSVACFYSVPKWHSRKYYSNTREKLPIRAQSVNTRNSKWNDKEWGRIRRSIRIAFMKIWCRSQSWNTSHRYYTQYLCLSRRLLILVVLQCWYEWEEKKGIRRCISDHDHAFTRCLLRYILKHKRERERERESGINLIAASIYIFVKLLFLKK